MAAVGGGSSAVQASTGVGEWEVVKAWEEEVAWEPFSRNRKEPVELGQLKLQRFPTVNQPNQSGFGGDLPCQGGGRVPAGPHEFFLVKPGEPVQALEQISRFLETAGAAARAWAHGRRHKGPEDLVLDQYWVHPDFRCSNWSFEGGWQPEPSPTHGQTRQNQN